MKRMLIVAALWGMIAPSLAWGQEHASAPGAAAEARMQPVLPHETTWAGVMVILIIAMFVAAIAVGLVVRYNAPQEVPPTHSHDEPPGTSGHHGASGTIDHHTHQH
jgi:hypothetical protein